MFAPFILVCGQCQEWAQGLRTTYPDQIVSGIVCDGSFSEFISGTYGDANMTTLPTENLPAFAAALGCQVATAWQALVDWAQIQDGEWLADFGKGGIGISTLVLGFVLGAYVVVVDIADDKLAVAMSLGTDAEVNAATCDAPQVVKALTGSGTEVAIEALGIDTTMQLLSRLGRMVQIAMSTEAPATLSLPMNVLYSGQISVRGTGGMPGWRDLPLLSSTSGGGVDLSPPMTRQTVLNQVSNEFTAVDIPTLPGVAVATDFVS